jgi:hypothetical protein
VAVVAVLQAQGAGLLLLAAAAAVALLWLVALGVPELAA